MVFPFGKSPKPQREPETHAKPDVPVGGMDLSGVDPCTTRFDLMVWLLPAPRLERAIADSQILEWAMAILVYPPRRDLIWGIARAKAQAEAFRALEIQENRRLDLLLDVEVRTPVPEEKLNVLLASLSECIRTIGRPALVRTSRPCQAYEESLEARDNSEWLRPVGVVPTSPATPAFEAPCKLLGTNIPLNPTDRIAAMVWLALAPRLQGLISEGQMQQWAGDILRCPTNRGPKFEWGVGTARCQVEPFQALEKRENRILDICIDVEVKRLISREDSNALVAWLNECLGRIGRPGVVQIRGA